MKIGNREVVHTAALLVPEGEDAWLQLTVYDWQPQFHLVLSRDEDENKTPRVTVEAEGEVGRLTLLNWLNPLGMATKVPLEVANTNSGLKLYVMIWQVRTDNVSRIDLQFSLERTP